MDIVAAFNDVGSYRGAAAICGVDHKTVKRALLRAVERATGEQPERSARQHNYDEMADVVAERVKNTRGRISAKRLLPEARAAGYDGSARNFRRLVAKAKRDWRSANHRGRRPGVWAPGEVLVFDWGAEGGSTSFAPCSPGAAGASCAFPPTRKQRRPSRCWPAASRPSEGCRKWCSLTAWAA
jgi:hypothetical protein